MDFWTQARKKTLEVYLTLPYHLSSENWQRASGFANMEFKPLRYSLSSQAARDGRRCGKWRETTHGGFGALFFKDLSAYGRTLHDDTHFVIEFYLLVSWFNKKERL